MYKEMERTLTITGSGETKQAAFQQALLRMREGIVRDTQDILLQIEPLDFAVVSAVQHTYTEKFLGFLFARVRTKYEVTANITVRLRLVELANLEFSERVRQPSRVRRILRMR
ncbi:DUF4312 family protein [Paenibacillus oralis]|uniref:DUF4312 family protein n=1 Tax=Paenibacillus oralis TaxID=2490856 RepID=A0A3P3U200_9BACL|nr:DUF4312 family protein [Paenibacillus oralis]RRJ64362.1 DUF4312 family protein [Paenibacillus oralis]